MLLELLEVPRVERVEALANLENENAEDLARRLKNVLQSRSNPQDLLNARELVLREFSPNALAAKAETLYQSVSISDFRLRKLSELETRSYRC